MNALSLVVSARRRGNCLDFAEHVMGRLRDESVETEIVNFDEHRIEPCHGCDYQCLRKEACPIGDDVAAIWRKVWETDLLFLFTPNYGGWPPALWVAFSQRSQALSFPDLKHAYASAVILATPHLSSGAQWTPSLMADELKWLGMRPACFELINNNGYAHGSSQGGLIKEEDVRRRLDFVAQRTLELAREQC